MPRPLLHQYQPAQDSSYSTQPQDSVQTVITRLPSSQLLTLNSADRFQNSNPKQGQSINAQPYNNFTLQRPQNLMEAFATRITVSEIRFPWYIPNINSQNNTIWMTDDSTPANVATITIPSGFYDLDGVATALNTAILASTLITPPTVSVLNGAQIVFTPAPGSGARFSIYWFNPFTLPTPPSVIPSNAQQYYTQPSLAKTIGLTYEQSSGGSNTTLPLIGNPTECLYTQYVDIVSQKLNQYARTRDGSSASSTNKALICRLYINDEISVNTYTSGSPGQIPFVIYRQFSNPKEIMWNKEAVIDWLDIAVLDEYGQLVPLPVIGGVQSSSPRETVGSYPDFQFSLLASEN